ncbi:MAG: hypothetical protein MK111_21510 [Crocosphaera sp.]|uniref:hypothetical protein n=1 Tax=Crocosphaera sp. TaxID=2729996 RepID=UPI00258A447D|nr:hypothetical protein [Crocosphaera sp.]MCH2247171.1 hypothetical protein [Crocosphaera sp.]
MLTSDVIELPVQIMGKVRGKIEVPADASQEDIETLQQELNIAELRVDALEYLRNWTEQTLVQLLQVEQLNLAQATLEQEFATQRQLGLDETITAKFEKQQADIERSRAIATAKLEQLNQLQAEDALQQALNDLRTDLGLQPIEDIIQQAEYKGQLAGILSELETIQNQPELPENIQTILAETTADIHDALQGKEAETIQENLLNSANALITEANELQTEIAKLDAEEERLLGILNQSLNDLQGATKALYDEIIISQELGEETDEINQEYLEVLYKIGYAEGAVDLSSELAQQSKDILNQIIEGRIEERKARKKEFLNSILDTYARVNEIVGTVLRVVGFVYPPAKAMSQVLLIHAKLVRATQAAYNGNWESAIYQVGTAVLKALTLEYDGKSVFEFKPSELKTLNQFEIGITTSYNTYQAYQAENHALAFASLVNGVANIAAVKFEVKGSLDHLSTLKKAAITLGQSSLDIYNTVEAIDNDEWLSAIKSIGSIASRIGSNFESDLEEFTKENLKDIYDIVYGEDNSSSDDIENTDDSFIGKIKSLIKQGEEYYEQAEDLLKENIGLDFEQLKKLYDTVDTLYDAHEDGSYQSWYNAINKALDLWEDDIQDALNNDDENQDNTDTVDDNYSDDSDNNNQDVSNIGDSNGNNESSELSVDNDLFTQEFEKAFPELFEDPENEQNQNDIYLVNQNGDIYKMAEEQDSPGTTTFQKLIDGGKLLDKTFGALDSGIFKQIPTKYKDLFHLDKIDGILESQQWKTISKINDYKSLGKVGGVFGLGLDSFQIFAAPTEKEKKEAIRSAIGGAIGNYIGFYTAVALVGTGTGGTGFILMGLMSHIGSETLKNTRTIHNRSNNIVYNWTDNLINHTENYGITNQETFVEPDGSIKKITTYNNPNSGYLVYTTVTSADRTFQETTVVNGRDTEQKERIVSQVHVQNGETYYVDFYPNSVVKSVITVKEQTQNIQVKEYDLESNLKSETTYPQNSDNIPVDIWKRVNQLVDPIVIDLNNDGVQLIGAENSSTFFDIDADGYAENTAWVSPEDGILTLDLNGDGTINNITEVFSEYFNDGSPNSGLDALATLDSNQNGIISATDTQFNQILVWQDINQDGISQPDELKTLTDHGITSINLNGITTETIQDGNIIKKRSIFNRNDGTSGEISDIAFLVTQTGFKVNQTETGIEILAEDDTAVSLFIHEDETDLTLNLADSNLQVAIANIGNDYLYTTETDDIFLSGEAGDDTLLGSDGNDWLVGDEGSDRLEGFAGDDLLYIDAQDNFIDGGEGTDIAIVTTIDAVTLDLGNANLEMVIGNDGDDIFTHSGNYTVVMDGGKGNDNLTGGSNDDVLTGGDGDDYIQGSDGSDRIEGSQGNDNLHGWVGSDEIYGGSDNDTLYGQQDNDSLYGDEGDDQLHGNEGDDSLEGGSGSDTLYGHQGNDTLLGNTGDDQLYGDAGDDSLQGGDGNDQLFGNIGHDILFGNQGHDLLYGEDGNDTISGNDGNDQLHGGKGADILHGGDGEDTLYGHFDDDTLTGGDGNDNLIGGEGADILTGGDDADIFLYNSFNDSTSTNPDRITDFETGDRIDLSKLPIYTIDDLTITQIDGITTISANSQDFVINLNNEIQLTPEDLILFNNITPTGLQFELTENTYQIGDSLHLKNGWVQDKNGLDDLKIIDFWLKSQDGSWQDLSDDISGENLEPWTEDPTWGGFIHQIKLDNINPGEYHLWAAAKDANDINQDTWSSEFMQPFTVEEAVIQENIPPTELQFQIAENSYKSGDTLHLENGWVQDKNGLNDIKVIDFWLKFEDGSWLNLSYDILGENLTPWITDPTWGEFTHQINLDNIPTGNHYLWAAARDTNDINQGTWSSQVMQPFTVEESVIEENISPTGLQFQITENTDESGDTLHLENGWVQDENGLDDLKIIDFWLKFEDGSWQDLSDDILGENLTPWPQDTTWGGFTHQIKLDNINPGDHYLWAAARDINDINQGTWSSQVMQPFTI